MFERVSCILCRSKSLDIYFPHDLQTPIASYSLLNKQNYSYIPFNIQMCRDCSTYQVKYLSDVNDTYDKNHVFSYSSLLHKQYADFSEFVLKNIDITSIVEVGSGNGFIADTILKSKTNLNYTIIDPEYFGNTLHRTVIPTFFENVENTTLNQDTLIMSHVFEHFYNPLDILEKIKEIPSIKNIYINFPNLEKFLSILHMNVLNIEHTFFIKNNSIPQLFQNYGFRLTEFVNYDDHAVFFSFVRDEQVQSVSLQGGLTNTQDLVDTFFLRIQENIMKINKKLVSLRTPVYIWPSSHQAQYLFIHGLDSSKITGFLDNSPNKIGYFLYGYDIPCVSFESILNSSSPALIIMNGGYYNQEIKNKYKDKHNLEFLFIE